MKKLLIIFLSIFILSTKFAFSDGHAIKKEGFFSKDFKITQLSNIQNPENLWLVLNDLIESDVTFKENVEIILIGNIDRRIFLSREFKKIRDRKIFSYMPKKSSILKYQNQNYLSFVQ